MSRLRVLSREDMLRPRERTREFVPIPEWGGDGAGVYVYVMTGTERDAYEVGVVSAGGDTATRMKNMRARLLIHCVMDEAGRPIFTADDVDQLGAQEFPILDRLVTVAQRLNRMSPAEMEKTKGN